MNTTQIIGPGKERPKLKVYESVDAYLKNQEGQTTTQEKEEPITLDQTIIQKDNYVFVPSIGLYVSKEKYLHNNNWNKTQELLHKEGRRMPTIYEFVEFLKYLRSNEGKRTVKNADSILDDIYTVRDPWRAEHLDAKFEDRNGQRYIHYHIFDGNGKIIPQYKKLDTCLMRDDIIDLESWLDNSTAQGLPKPNYKDGSLYYWNPENGRVAGFVANSGWASLDCNEGAGDSDSILGVRYVERGDAK